MLDFTSALYLGLRHPTRSLRPWDSLTTGVPAALGAPTDSAAVARALAALQGCEAATLATSTLHVAWDLLALVAGEDRVAILVDRNVYPVVRWGVERAAWHGVPVTAFRHLDADALAAAVRSGERRARPLIVTDGYCPGCSRPAPLARYLELARRHGGRVLIDDTQALGILGPAGGGSLRSQDVEGPELVVTASLAKGLGAPVATLSGAAETVRRFETRSETRVHSSPPSIAALRAAAHALTVNRRGGDELRDRLVRLVRHWHGALATLGLRGAGGLFPVQTLPAIAGVDPAFLHLLLLERGVKTVLHRPHNGAAPRVSLLITARHRRSELDAAAEALAHAIAVRQPQPGGSG